ncbi:hypothetical protein BP6252_10903 [Coleophoma cylindrospora]|uniref:AAA+ ATPase domain-containing protein n=1 Tax=Coleophoma cylindrospora TaxID=1849047 RepID=A0A3D8QNV7_9HELO|nr:hypothetical protein BP6252_10903 [Coleophoma cylindrospora]
MPSSVSSSDDEDDTRSQVSLSTSDGSVINGEPQFRVIVDPNLEPSGSTDIFYRAAWVKKEPKSKKPKYIGEYLSSKTIELQTYTPSAIPTDLKPPFELISIFSASRITSESTHEKAGVSAAVDSTSTPIVETDTENVERPSIPGNPDSPEEKKTEKVALKDLRIHNVWTTKMKIWSPILLSNLHAHTQIFEGYDKYGVEHKPGYTMLDPYFDLLWNIETIRALAEPNPIKALPGKPGDHEQYSDTERAAHFSKLREFLEPIVQTTLVPTQKLLLIPSPIMPFNLLPWIFSEGTEIYIRDSNDKSLPYAGLVTTLGLFSKFLRVFYWRIAADGEDFGRTMLSVDIPIYQSERKVTGLVAFPAQFLDAEDDGATRRALIERGKAYYNVVTGGQKEMTHSGKAYDETRNPTSFTYDGNVVVDHVGAFNSIIQPPVGIRRQFHLQGRLEEIPEWPFGILSPTTDGSSEDVKGLFEWWELSATTNRTLTDKHFLIMEHRTLVYAIKDKRWLIDVKNLQEVHRAKDPLSNVVIRKEDIEIIKALSFREKNAEKAWGADFIEGKGLGQIVLLHGPPGVGKTYTVECIAESFARPLLSLTVANLGTRESDVDVELTKWLAMAERWKAVLLIDEADVFLERRAHSDLERNQLVAVFLRKMEYCTGILFLTTNRVGQIDDAFASRIHVIIGYGRLDDDGRAQIWKNFFNKLKHDKGGKIIIGKQAKEFVSSGEEMKKLQWNGREIRNGLQTAIAIAEYEASLDKDRDTLEPIVVEEGHFKQVMRMSNNFKNYMFSVGKEDESKRALQRRDRNDFNVGVKD